MDTLDFVENVKKYCTIKGVAPTVACKESGAGKDLIPNIKKGQTPSVAKVQLLAQYLGVTTSDLLGETRSVPDSDTLGAADVQVLAAYHAAPAEIRAIVDAALKPYIGCLKGT